jgi:hypothetical protein
LGVSEALTILTVIIRQRVRPEVAGPMTSSGG